MRFDWYSATFRADPDSVLRVFSGAFDLSDCVQVRAKNGFHHAAQFKRGNRVLCEVSWGGPNTGERVHVQGTGENALKVSQVLRESFPEHSVTRADVAQDYDDPGAWAFWSDHAERLARARNLNYNVYQSGIDSEGGRTIYIGSEKSVVMLRIYEKGKKEGGSPGWVRVELVVKPKRQDARMRLSAAPYRDFFGCAVWAQAIAEAMGLEDVPRVRAGSVYSLSEIEGKRLSLATQYGRTILEWLQEAGDFEELGVQMYALVQHAEALKRKSYPVSMEVRLCG